MRARQKRRFDIIMSLVLLVPAVPIMLGLGLAVRLTSRGPVLFRQERIGLNGQAFTIFKFRTMRHESGPFHACKHNDHRVTPVGKWLRHYKLDELPQLFNVLNGTMSLVGPRPYETSMDDELAGTIDGYDWRHRVKPGITGPGKLQSRKLNPEIKREVEHDLVYASQPFRWLTDLKYLEQTIVYAIRA